jgi:hypothetical protein
MIVVWKPCFCNNGVFSCWKILNKKYNAAKGFTTLTTMQLYKISNSKSQFSHCKKGGTNFLQLTSNYSFTLMFKVACKTYNKSQNLWTWLRKHYFTTGINVLVTTLAIAHVFPHGALDYNWRL